VTRPIQLRAKEHDAPVCESFGDEASVVDYERAMREHRALIADWRVEHRDDVSDTFVVHGVEGGRYRVDLVDGEELDVCECPDFLSNGLGTCKHLEAALRAVKSRASLLRAFERLSNRPAVPTLTLARGEHGLSVHAVGPFKAPQLRALGVTPERGGWIRDPAALVSAEVPDGVRVPSAVLRFAREESARLGRARRRREVEADIDAGRLRLDVLRTPLFPYQVQGVRHLVAAGRALLADDMGLGKTVQALAACEVLRARGEASRILIVTSASLKDQWAREIRRHTGASCAVVDGAAPMRRVALEGDAPYKILNYEQTWRELSLLQRLDADVVVLDEAQRAKNFRTRTASTLRAIPARFAFVLTGTPVENRLDDLYALMQLVDPAVLGPLWRFNLDFHTQSPRGKVEGYKNLGALRARIAPVLLRRRKEEVLLQLPPITHQTRYIPLTEEAASLEAGYRADAARWLSLAERRALTLEEQQKLMGALLKARQACDDTRLCDPARTEDRSPKLDELESLVTEICAQGGSKVLVFSEWVEMLKLASARLRGAGIESVMLHGGIPTEKRPALLERFREDDAVKVLLSTDAGGTGLNLQVASYVIHLDLPWNPGRLDQRTARAHRLGQTRGVSVTYLCAATGIERGIELTLDGKRAIRAAALDVTSDVEEMSTPSFMTTVRQLKRTLETLEGAPDETEAIAPQGDVTPLDDAAPAPEEHADTAPPAMTSSVVLEALAPPAMTSSVVPEAVAPPAMTSSVVLEALAPPPRTHRAPRVEKRLRLARVVLDAGFAGDAVRASYEALFHAVAALLEGDAPATHAALVAAIYRDLTPRGLVPAGLHPVLARLYDLTTLEGHGVEVDDALAREAVADAEAWVTRLAG
jgi:superfamily II DNA or RNA helicase/uncharacterized protein (UPF0332 family)